VTDGATSLHTAGSSSTAPRWVKLTRSGNTITAFESSNGSSWTQVGSDTFSMPSSVLIGLAVSSHVSDVTCTSTFDGVFVSSSAPPPSSLPQGWSDTDVGATDAGSATYDGSTFTVSGQGADIWGTADAFNYAYRTTTGDATIIARVASVENTAAWAKAGVMIRSSLSASSAHAFMLVSAGKGMAFQRRVSAGASTLHTSGSSSTAPRWVKLTRSGNTITAFESSNGSTWTEVGSDTFSMPSTVLIGLAVSSHVSGVTCTSTFDGVTISSSAQASLPPGWNDTDVGAVSGVGSASYDSSTFSVTGQGADIWGTADAFNYAYRTMSGDGTITARVASVQNVDRWTKAGVMIRETLSDDSAHAYALVSAGKGVAFQRRPTTGGLSVNTGGTASEAPRWVKLSRAGDVLSAYESGDGNTWSLIGTDTIAMSDSVLVGLAVTSHNDTSPATATFDSVIIE
jgi:regulation of enolase protein 1 (concanavalin A-like superfamily)